VFEATDKDDFARRTSDLNDLKEELYSRFNTFNETLKDSKEE
jgi:hypothetical protein